MKRSSVRSIGTLAIVISEVGLINAITSLPINSSSPLYSIFNDATVVAEAFLSAVFAWLVYNVCRNRSNPVYLIGLASTLAGMFIVLFGTTMDLFGRISWHNAGLLVIVGNGMLGIWLIGINATALIHRTSSHRIAFLGLLTGFVMTISLLAAPGLLIPFDSSETSPWFLIIGNFGGFGWFFLYPIWAFSFGMHLTSNSSDTSPAFIF